MKLNVGWRPEDVNDNMEKEQIIIFCFIGVIWRELYEFAKLHGYKYDFKNQNPIQRMVFYGDFPNLSLEDEKVIVDHFKTFGWKLEINKPNIVFTPII